MLTMTACFFFPAPEHTNPFDPAFSDQLCSVSLVSNKFQLIWSTSTLDSGTVSYKVITSAVAEDMMTAVKNYMTSSNLKSILTMTNIKDMNINTVRKQTNGFNMTIPNYFAVIYRTATAAKGSTIATYKP